MSRAPLFIPITNFKEADAGAWLVSQCEMEADDAFMDTDTRLVAFTVGATPAPPPAAVDADRGHRGPVGEGDGEAVLTDSLNDWLRALMTRCEVCDE